MQTRTGAQTSGDPDVLKVYRVYNGWTGETAVHRIVVAFSEEGARRAAFDTSMKGWNEERLIPEWQVEQLCDVQEGAASEEYS